MMDEAESATKEAKIPPEVLVTKVCYNDEFFK
jgi:hypothetical protein